VLKFSTFISHRQIASFSDNRTRIGGLPQLCTLHHYYILVSFYTVIFHLDPSFYFFYGLAPERGAKTSNFPDQEPRQRKSISNTGGGERFDRTWALHYTILLLYGHGVQGAYGFACCDIVTIHKHILLGHHG
jgi:hypothetical protein